MKQFFQKYALWITAIIVVVILFAVFYFIGKKQGGGYTVKDDNGNTVTLTQTQLQEARALATEIYNELQSGWIFGLNIWGNIGRNTAVYQKLAAQSDTMFAATCQAYFQAYGTSLISDLNAESSLPHDADYFVIITEKANRLKLA